MIDLLTRILESLQEVEVVTKNSLQNLWVAPINYTAKFSLNFFEWIQVHPNIYLIEVYKNIRQEDSHIRVYLNHVDTFIPCFVFGEVGGIHTLAQRNNSIATSIYMTELETDITHTVPTVDLLAFIQLKYPQLFLGFDKITFFMRPCSFVMNLVQEIYVGAVGKFRVKFYGNMVNKKTGEFFVHITYPDEVSYLSSLNCYGLVLTNSREYKESKSTNLVFEKISTSNNK